MSLATSTLLGNIAFVTLFALTVIAPVLFMRRFLDRRVMNLLERVLHIKLAYDYKGAWSVTQDKSNNLSVRHFLTDLIITAVQATFYLFGILAVFAPVAFVILTLTSR